MSQVIPLKLKIKVYANTRKPRTYLKMKQTKDKRLGQKYPYHIRHLDYSSIFLKRGKKDHGRTD